MFVDTVTLSLSAGKGGNGIIAWRREKFVPKGGPAGGDGGRGGSIILEADPQIFSLETLRNRRILKAENGKPGQGNRCKGKNGRDLVLKIPPGTLVKNPHTQETLYDFTEPGQEWVPCRGGAGGKGNSRFKSSTHQAPFICTEGASGEILEVELELKLIADVGLVGMPNAGKSTLISKLTQIQVKIAPYPFTTLQPNLGIFETEDFQRILVADIPGLIQDASKNRGLGVSFLKHVERTAALLFVIELAPQEERDPFAEFLMLQNELKAYDPALLEKPFLVALNKTDQEGAQKLVTEFQKRYPYDPATLWAFSALEDDDFSLLKKALADQVNSNSNRHHRHRLHHIDPQILSEAYPL